MTEMHLLGYGTYDGDMVPDVQPFKSMQIANPKITLDDGRVVWGFQCWWGPEERIKAMEATRTVVPATIP